MESKIKEGETLFVFGLFLLVIGAISTLISFVWQQYFSLGNFLDYKNLLFNLRSTGIFTFFVGILTLFLNYQLDK